MSENQKNTFSAVTTFNFRKHPYGIEMIESFFINWPNNVMLTAFIENSDSPSKLVSWGVSQAPHELKKAIAKRAIKTFILFHSLCE